MCEDTERSTDGFFIFFFYYQKTNLSSSAYLEVPFCLFRKQYVYNVHIKFYVIALEERTIGGLVEVRSAKMGTAYFSRDPLSLFRCLRAALLLELLAIYSEYVYWSVTVILLSLFFLLRSPLM
jgi:hypothetical protein